jgi:hypothetical protein
MKRFILGKSSGARLDEMTEILGDKAGAFVGFGFPNFRGGFRGGQGQGGRRRHHRGGWGQQPGQQPSQWQPPAYAAQPPPAAPPPDVTQPSPVTPPPGPQPTIDVFVGACMRQGHKAQRIASVLGRMGYSPTQIRRAFDRNM